MSFRIKKFFSYYKPYLGLFFSVIVCAFIAATVTLVIPLCTRYITKNVLQGNMSNPLQQIYQVGALMVFLVIIQKACNFYYDYWGHVMGAMMENDMRKELFGHYQKLSFSFYDERKIGKLMSRITNDLLLLSELYHHGPEDYVVYLVKFIGAFVILIRINTKLALVVFAFLPIMAIYSLYFNKKINAAIKRNYEKIGDINAQVEDSLSGIRVVKSFANEELEIKKFAKQNNKFLESRKNIYRNEAFIYNGVDIFIHLITVTVVVFGGVCIVKATLDLADLITFLMYISSLIEPVQKLNHMTVQFQQGISGFQRFMDILEIEPDIKDMPNAIELEDVKGDVEFINVGFKYSKGQDYVLKNINLKVKAGEYIALVGYSGVGKTTLCSLLPRFYELTEGKILLDGIDIRKIKLDSLRKSIGVVQQDVYLFSGTVLENIRYGKPNATKEEVIEAAKKANAHEFIMDLPDGYYTDIGQRGIKLSGGQKQRLSIARVFLKNPPILIFDEATSALDNESEKIVQSSLQQLAQNRTTFVIAHRLSTIRNAERIIVLSDDGIEEEGSFEELIALNGSFARLYKTQLDNYYNI
ncbi:MAG: ABC transporter ATP-binding protein [Clostridiales bacterium]|nr:ABC transporter ATP-binding protein [Clostridiales bacterium]